MLAANPEFSAGVRRLVKGDAGDTGLDPAKIEQVLGQPEDFPHYLGVLGTAAMSVGLIAPQR